MRASRRCRYSPSTRRVSCCLPAARCCSPHSDTDRRPAPSATRDAPDQFTVTTRARVSMPPDYICAHPPRAARPQEQSERAQAEEILVPQTALAGGQGGAASAGQSALLQQTGPSAPADIRRRVDQDARQDQAMPASSTSRWIRCRAQHLRMRSSIRRRNRSACARTRRSARRWRPATRRSSSSAARGGSSTCSPGCSGIDVRDWGKPLGPHAAFVQIAGNPVFVGQGTGELACRCGQFGPGARLLSAQLPGPSTSSAQAAARSPPRPACRRWPAC